jgi:hypothetical protein
MVVLPLCFICSARQGFLQAEAQCPEDIEGKSSAASEIKCRKIMTSLSGLDPLRLSSKAGYDYPHRACTCNHVLFEDV